MTYIKVSVETTGACAELLADTLAEITGGCEVDDPAALAAWAERNRGRWDYLDDSLIENQGRPVTVAFYTQDDPAGRELVLAAGREVARIQAEAGGEDWGPLTIRVAPMENQDWANSWREHFKPFAIGDRLLVKPSWEDVSNSEGRIILTIDPSVSFGTGTHATTRLCLEVLAEQDLAGQRVLDMGCGSGILACGAVLLGASHAVCCDIEADAMRVSAENMARNGIDNSQYTLLCGDILSDPGVQSGLSERGPFDLITANLVADLLIAMAGKLGGLAAPNGRLIFSGILDARSDAVCRAAGEAGLRLLDTRRLDGWTTLIFAR